MDQLMQSNCLAAVDLARTRRVKREKRPDVGFAGVCPSKLSRVSEQGVDSPAERRRLKRETDDPNGDWIDASEICLAELRSDQGSLSLAEDRVPSLGPSANSNLKVAKTPRLRPVPRGHFPCDVCHVAFVRNCDLRIHRRRHTGEKPYACDSCEARFTRSSHLTVHKRTHSGEKPYSCDTCGARFTRNCDLTMHKRTHSGDKRYACDLCASRFTRSFHLTTHKRTHSGERPYACAVCVARFTTSSNLTSHMRSHSGEKPYACEACAIRFTRSCDLARHKRSHTRREKLEACETEFATGCDLSPHGRSRSDEAYRCCICDASFGRSAELTKHKRLHSAGDLGDVT